MTGQATRLAGVDEAGRGPLAGPVLAAAVILNPERPIVGLGDSKLLSASRREALAAEIRRHALAWALAEASVAEIDSLNILQASLLAMGRAVAGLAISPTEILVDGNRLPDGLPCVARAVVDGDKTVPAIGAASILAKTHRDAILMDLDERYPGYGLARHKGYGTREHLAALARLGPTPIHRRSFAPVRRLLGGFGESIPSHRKPRS